MFYPIVSVCLYIASQSYCSQGVDLRGYKTQAECQEQIEPLKQATKRVVYRVTFAPSEALAHSVARCKFLPEKNK